MPNTARPNGPIDPRLVIMVRDTGKHTPHSPEALFSATQAPIPHSRQFWASLITQRPLLLLGSLWLVMICVSALAAHRLLFADPGKGTQAHRVQSQAIVPEAASGQSASPSEAGAEDNSAAPSRPGRKITFWGLSSLVGLCALGSLVISQQAKAAARQRPKRRVRRVKPKVKAKAPTGPKRLQPYSPDRDAVIVKGAQAVRDTLPLSLAETESEPDLFDDNRADTPQDHSLTNAVFAPQSQLPQQGRPRPGHPEEGQRSNGKTARPPIAPQPLAAQPSTLPPHNAPTHPTEVLPQEEAHPLDWTEDSLAHTLDLRQRRSLSSLM